MKKLIVIFLVIISLSSCGQGNFYGSHNYDLCYLNLQIGDSYGGGIVAYLFVPGDNKYVPDECHGLIAATVDQSINIDWGLSETQYPDIIIGTSAVIGTGKENTAKILAYYGSGFYAAYIATQHSDGGFTDWFLPSYEELRKLYINRALIGNFNSTQYIHYWSSTELAGSAIWIEDISFYDGFYSNLSKHTNFTVRVRAVRYF